MLVEKVLKFFDMKTSDDFDECFRQAPTVSSIAVVCVGLACLADKFFDSYKNSEVKDNEKE